MAAKYRLFILSSLLLASLATGLGAVLNAWFVQWWKTGREPTTDHDRLILH